MEDIKIEVSFMEDNTQIKEAGNLKPNKFKVPIIIGLFLAAAIASFFLFNSLFYILGSCLN